MNYYSGQKYNPVEDDNITTESMFKVINGDTGELMDVREMLGITEEDFKNNPELLNAIVHMNNIQPLDTQPKAQEIYEETKDDGSGAGASAAAGGTGSDGKPRKSDVNNGGGENQKERHFRYFEMLDTIPVKKSADGGNDGQEVMLEFNAEGASQNVISWK